MDTQKHFCRIGLTVVLLLVLSTAALGSSLLVDDGGSRVPPSIQPIIFLEGSDYDIGYQYGYFGANYIETFSNHVWAEIFQGGHRGAEEGTREEIETILRGFHYHMEETFPEVVEAMQGMLDGVNDAGYDLDYDDILVASHQWDIVASYGAEYPPVDPDEKLAGKGCSTFTAWGSKTEDGRVVAGNSADGEFGPQVTMVIFPETGHNLVSTAEFGVWAWNFTVNSAGLYQAINWTPAARDEDMDYGLASTLVIYRNGRFAGSAAEAEAMMRELPLTIGENYLFVDREHDGRVLETSAAFVERRVPGDLGEEDMLVSSNNRFIEAAQAAGIGGGMDRYEQLARLGELGAGYIDEDYVKLMFGLPPVARPGNRGIHIASITDDAVSVQIATGAASPVGSWRTGPVRPTFSFYGLDLKDTPEAVTQSTKSLAQDTLASANLLAAEAGASNDPVMVEAREEYFRGMGYEDAAYRESGNARLLLLSKAATAYTRSQAFSNQLMNELQEPTDNPWLYIHDKQ